MERHIIGWVFKVYAKKTEPQKFALSQTISKLVFKYFEGQQNEVYSRKQSNNARAQTEISKSLYSFHEIMGTSVNFHQEIC